MKNVAGIGLCLFLLLLGSTQVFAATEEDLMNAVTQLIGEDNYVYFDHEGTTVDVDGYRTKSWGTNGDLTDSGGGHGWEENIEFVESLSGLESSLSYEIYVLTGGRVSTSANQNWGVQVGFETGVYSLITADVADDASVTSYNLGEYDNGTSFPFRETQGDVNAACMYAVYVGTATTDESGNLTVYVNNVNAVDIDGNIGERTWYDGILVIPNQEAFDPVPADETGSVDIALTTLSWSAPRDDYTYDIYFGTTEPNALETNYGISKLNVFTQSETSIEIGSELAYSTTYYWLVEAYEPGNSTPFVGESWSFTTMPFDTAPIVDAGSSYITWLDNMPQDVAGTVDASGEDDVADEDVIWAISEYAGDPIAATMQMYDRGMNNAAAEAQNVAGFDPNILSDWIGTDSRQNPCSLMVLTLTGLPAGEYTWTSTHHDLNDQTYLFDVYVGEDLASVEIDISNGTQTPTEYSTTLTSDGVNPVQISFDAHQQVSGMGGTGFFVLNAFELTDGTNTMKVDFGTEESSVAVGYEAYVAAHEVPETFTAQDFTFGSATVTLLPQWGPYAAGWINASLTKTSTDPAAPTAVFTTDYPGIYTLELTATDDTVYGEEALSASETITIQVADDACAAAQLSDSWTDFDFYDVDNNCVVDLSDFAAFAATWLDSKVLLESEAY